jgi:hypothetical protein
MTCLLQTIDTLLQRTDLPCYLHAAWHTHLDICFKLTTQRNGSYIIFMQL